MKQHFKIIFFSGTKIFSDLWIEKMSAAQLLALNLLTNVK